MHLIELQNDLVEYLQLINTNVPADAINLVSTQKITQVIGLDRPVIAYDGSYIHLNGYSMLLMYSGGGKDRMLTQLNAVTGGYSGEFSRRVDDHTNRLKAQVETKAEEIKNQSSKMKYINDNQPRHIVDEFSDATAEGLNAMRESMLTAGFGTMAYVNTEIGDVLGRRDEVAKTMLSIVKEAYDGTTKAKLLKSEKIIKPITNCPINVMVMSPISSITNEKSKEELIKWLDSGMARRLNVCIVKSPTGLAITANQAIENKKIANAKAKLISKKITDMVKANKNRRILLLSQGAYLALEEFKIQSESKLKPRMSEGEAAELTARWYRALKLSGVLFLANTKSGTSIGAEYVHMAISQVCEYANHFINIYQIEANSPAAKIYAALEDSEGLTTEQVRLASGLTTSGYYLAKKQIWQEIAEICEKENTAIEAKRGLEGKLFVFRNLA